MSGATRAIGAGLALLLAQQASGGVHTPQVEGRLAALVGDWTLEGQQDSYRELCEWFADRAFVVCRASDSTDGSSSVSILGYSVAEGRFTYHHYNGRGTSRSEAGFPHGVGGIVYTAERKTSSGVVRSTTTLTPVPDGRLHFRLERSVDGGPWTVAAEFHYIPRGSQRGRE